MNHLVWYRSDLRVHDHAALVNAAKMAKSAGTEVFALYFWSEQQVRSHGGGNAKLAAVGGALHSLSKSLSELGIRFNIIAVESWQAIPQHLLSFIKKNKISSVHFHEEPGYNEITRDNSVKASIPDSINFYSYQDLFLVSPFENLTKQGTPFKKFTPFKQAVLRHNWLQQPLPKPDKCSKTAAPLAKVPKTPAWSNPLNLPVTEEEAHFQLELFLDSLSHYKVERDFPYQPGTSLLSVALANGCITSRQIAWAIQQRGVSLNEDTYFSEILWREFFKYLIAHQPELCLSQPFNPHNDQFPWNTNSKWIEAWKQGKTGVPIVDAAMRQLTSTGWMHNRLRMISAMYLCKIMQVNWRLGEAFFAEHLADFDFCANNGGWQWVSSTGADGVPYFRIFNPYEQSKKFDPEGLFIKQYIPELADLNKQEIHQPAQDMFSSLDYPQPMVNYSEARKDTLDKFSQLKQQAVTL